MPSEPQTGAGATTVPAGERPLSFAAVNGWRGPGALAIAMAHFGIATDFVTARDLAPVALLVDLFFVLSGLMIAQAYSARLSSAANIPEYVIRRLGRIWPVQAATMAVLIAYELAKLASQSLFGTTFSSPPFGGGGDKLVSAIPTNLLLIQSLGLHDRETWNFPSWSLSVEFATYVAFAAFCLLAPRLRRALTLATIVISMLILVAVAPQGMRSTFDYGIFRCLAGFFTGTLCYEAAARWRVPCWRYATLIEVAAVALVVAWLVTSRGSVSAYAAPLVFAVFVLAFLGEGGLLSRALRTPPLQKLAELSFSIYMVHAVVLMFGLALLHAFAKRFHLDLFRLVENPLTGRFGAHPIVEQVHLEGTLARLLVLSLYLSGLIAATMLAYAFVEVPGRRLFTSVARRFGSLAGRITAARRGEALDPDMRSMGHAP